MAEQSPLLRDIDLERDAKEETLGGLISREVGQLFSEDAASASPEPICCLCMSCMLTCGSLGILSFGFTLMYVGITSFNRALACNLPMWCFVWGLFLSMAMVLWCGMCVRGYSLLYSGLLNCVLVTFGMWFIVGNVWYYQSTLSDSGCGQGIYHFVGVVLLTSWITLAVFVLPTIIAFLIAVYQRGATHLSRSQ